MDIERGTATANGIILDNDTQVLFKGRPGVIVIAPGTVSPVRLFVPQGMGGQWRDKWMDLDEAVRQTDNVTRYGWAAAVGGQVWVAPLLPNTNPETFVDYQAYSDAYAAMYGGS